MSKALKKLIDINRLREFKNKLVGEGSAYVQTTAIDQTIAGTKTFSKPIVGSVTGSSGSCTGNAATATTATTAKACTGNAATATQFSANKAVTLTGDVTGTASSKAGWSVATTLANSGVTAGTYGPSADVTGNNNATISVPEITVDAKGRVTSVTNRTLTCKNNTYTVNNATLTIQKNGTTVKTFTANSNTNVTANISVPTKTSDLTNDSHVSITTEEDTTSTGTPAHGGTFTCIDSVTRDSNGHVTKVNTKTVTLPSDRNTDTLVTQNVSTANENHPILLSATKDATTNQGAKTSIFASGVKVNPSTGTVTATAFSGNLTGNVTGNISGSSGSCTGNAATATKLATARSLWGNNFDGSAAISGTITGTPSIEFKPTATTSNNGGFLDFHYNQSTADYTSRIIESASGTLSINNVTITTGKVVTATTFNGALKGNVTGNCSGSSGSCTGNAASANIATKATQDSDGNKITTTYSKNGHTHDDRYYTENEVNNLLNGKANTSGTYSNLTVGKADSATKAANADHATKADSATRATSADRASAADFVQSQISDYHEIRFDWASQVSGHVGLRVDATDMGGIITTNRLVSDIRAQWYAAYPDGPEAHNAMWGGRDITAVFDSGEFSEHVADGTFKDIFPGDYITKQVTIGGTAYTVNWVVTDCDYWWHKGDQYYGMETHHVAIVPQQPIFDARMNQNNVTEVGYASSWLYTYVIPACAKGLVSAFGSDHILTFRDGISDSVDTSHVSSGIPQWTGTPVWWGTWVSVQCNLMSEKMVYGAPVCAAGAMDNAMATRQMSAFRLSERLINYDRQWWWLRDVVSSAYFARVGGTGDAGATDASSVGGVRPFALLR